MSSTFKNFAELQRNQEQCITSGRKFSATLGFDETAYYDAAQFALDNVISCPAERRAEFAAYGSEHYYALWKETGDDGCNAQFNMYEFFRAVLKYNPHLAH